MRRLVLLLAVCFAIVGCEKGDDGLRSQVGAYSLFDPAAVNPSLCGAGAIPFPNNAFFAAATASGVTTDTTLNIPSTASTAVAANLTDGFSTTASIFTDVLGAIDFASAANAIYILEADASPRILTPGIDYTLQPSIALGQVSGTGGCALDPTVNTGAAKFLPISQQRTRILIEPLKPLNASTNYIVVVTRDLLSVDGVPATTNEFFPIVNSSTSICDRAGTDANLVDCSDPAAPADAAARLNAPALTTMTAAMPNPTGGPPAIISGAAAAAARLTTLEILRANLVRPTVLGFQGLAPAAGGPTVADDDIVIAWSFTTQSIAATLRTMILDPTVTSAKAFAVAAAPGPGGTLSTGELGLGLADTADIFVGTLNAVPYYLDDAGNANDYPSQCIGTTPGVDCNGFWANNGTVTCNSFASCAATGGFVPWTPLGNYDGDTNTPNTPAQCNTGVPPFNFVAPLSTTNCHRVPLERSQENLLVLITVPNANSGQTEPAGGWPVVIFQHGITGNRTQALPLAPTLASQGFVVVSIDLPLHGLVPAGSVPTCGSTSNNSFYVAGAERTFDLDLVTNATGAFAPDNPAIVDCSGTHFINLGSLITSRDNLRQAVADQIHLIKSLQAADPMNLDGTAGDDIDETRMHFAGISLGSIVGTTLLGVDTGASATVDGSDESIIAASLSVPGGGMAKLLDASASFGPRISAGLAGVAFSTNLSGVGSPFEGTDTYETFVRFAQHLVDPGDPINFAVAAEDNHRIHMTMVDNDSVVPNTAFSTCPAAGDLPPGIGAAAASNAVNVTRDAACDAGAKLVGGNQATNALCPDVVAISANKVCTNSAGSDEVLISGFLSGTEPLYGEMGLTVAGPITPPAMATNQDCAGLDVVVQFAIGSHGSLLDPTASAVTTVEMQRQAATYLRSDGTSLGTLCP